MVDNTLWLIEEEEYLRDLSKLCQELSCKFKAYHDLYRSRQAKFKIPAIVISSITGIVSFGTSNFPAEYTNYVSIGVGISSLCIALINAIESYMKIGETMSGCIQASSSFQKLKETIDVELSLPHDDRCLQGIIFLRDCFSKYIKIWDLAPTIIKNIRFIRPSFDPTKKFDISSLPNDIISSSNVNNTIQNFTEFNTTINGNHKSIKTANSMLFV
jgi:hypothetical protein